jgi:hypothetical protein
LDDFTTYKTHLIKHIEASAKKALNLINVKKDQTKQRAAGIGGWMERLATRYAVESDARQFSLKGLAFCNKNKKRILARFRKPESRATHCQDRYIQRISVSKDRCW